MAIPLFDPDALRSFATGVALGSYAKAADRLGRSTSAVSAQLKKLEMQAGTPLFRKAGRGLALTDAGETLLAYARRLLDLNQEAATALRSANLQGLVKLGLQEDCGETLLPAVLGRFARAHPKVRLEVCVARSAELRERLTLRQIDLALVWETDARTPLPHGEALLSAPLQWLGMAGWEDAPPAWLPGQHLSSNTAQEEPLPLVLPDAPCLVREIVTTALAQRGIAWRNAFTSASLTALWAAAAAGLGLTVCPSVGLPPTVRPLDAATCGLPPLPQVALWLYRGVETPEPAALALAALLREAVAEIPVPVC